MKKRLLLQHSKWLKTKLVTHGKYYIAHRLCQFLANLIVLIQFSRKRLPPSPRFLLYVAEGDCITKGSLENGKAGTGQKKIRVMHFVYRPLVRIFLIWFASLFAFLMCSYFVIIGYNVHLDRHCTCHSGVLWQHTLRWRSGSKVFIRDQLPWKDIGRKKDWAEAKLILWCRHSTVLASPAEFRHQHSQVQGWMGGSFCRLLAQPQLQAVLQDGQPCGRGQQPRLALPIPQTWQQAPCQKEDLSSTSYL